MTKTAFVTGGASGIGAATCQLLSKAGYRVYIADIQKDPGELLAQNLGDSVFLELNVRNEADFESGLAQVMSETRRLDVMINNAAIVGTLGPISSLPVDQYDLSQEIIQRSAVLGTKHAAKIMQEQKFGAIVNVASIAGVMGGYSPHTYAACKAAVIQFTQSVALELAEDNIRVNAVCPGAIATPIHTGTTGPEWKETIKKVKESCANFQAIPRMGEPSEIAEAIVWLASEKSSYVTGQALAVDGGATAGKIWREQPDFFKQFHPARS
jgi:NAD(P)-dependent dehydrogenase (short-subunit alcohol dehydrogenase family)